MVVVVGSIGLNMKEIRCSIKSRSNSQTVATTTTTAAQFENGSRLLRSSEQQERPNANLGPHRTLSSLGSRVLQITNFEVLNLFRPSLSPLWLLIMPTTTTAKTILPFLLWNNFCQRGHKRAKASCSAHYLWPLGELPPALWPCSPKVTTD